MEAIFELKMVNGIGCVEVEGTGGVKSMKVAFEFDSDFGSNGRIRSYNYSGPNTSTICTPVGWTLKEWNVFKVITKAGKVEIYRACEDYREVLHFELIGSVSYVPYGGAGGDRFWFGNGTPASANVATNPNGDFFILMGWCSYE
jgi:hypothetical protein